VEKNEEGCAVVRIMTNISLMIPSLVGSPRVIEAIRKPLTESLCNEFRRWCGVS